MIMKQSRPLNHDIQAQRKENTSKEYIPFNKKRDIKF